MGEKNVERRNRLLESLGGGSVLVRGGGGEAVDPSFYYLTGISEPRGALLLADEDLRIKTGRSNPGREYVCGETARQILFLPPRDELAAQWGEDAEATVANTEPSVAGVDAVLPTTDFESILTQCLRRGGTLHVVRNRLPSLSGADDSDTALAQKIRSRFVGVNLRDATAPVHEMRSIKDDEEIAAIERSVSVTAEALDRVLDLLAPGLRECEVEAEIARVYRARGGVHAFEPIVGAGENALKLHYRSNSGTLGADAILLVDTGVALDGYHSDITRSYPVSGRFTARQRQVYSTVLEALETTTAACKPGVTLGDLHACAYDVIAAAGFGEYFPHGTSHHLGLETHDVGELHRPLQAGAVITVEPGIYIPGEEIGVRVEDDVLITNNGPRVLSSAIPKSIEAIEQRLARRSR